jgi:NADH-quinone oxidoreductase subunit J
MVLYVFVVAYVGGQDEPLGARPGRGLRLTAALCGAALFVELCIATLGSALPAIDTDGAALKAGFGSPAQIGELLLTDFLLPFEIASFLLLIAAVGAVVLARRRGGISAAEDQARYSAMDMLRPAFTGTMAEAVGGQRPGPARILPASAPAAVTADEPPDEPSPADGA